MKFLYLGYPNNAIHKFLSSKGEVFQTQQKLEKNYTIENFDWVISYGYSHIIKKSMLDKSSNPIINLHVSYLPYNRGASPNFWSWLEDTPKGVTLHFIDEGIDTGDILIQKEVIFDEDETLTSSYNKLKLEIEKLFMENFDDIIRSKILPKKQEESGTFHLLKDFIKHEHLLTEGWDTPVKKLK